MDVSSSLTVHCLAENSWSQIDQYFTPNGSGDIVEDLTSKSGPVEKINQVHWHHSQVSFQEEERESNQVCQDLTRFPIIKQLSEINMLMDRMQRPFESYFH